MGNVGDKIIAQNAKWSFGGEVSATFDEHVRKSVPLYAIGHDLLAKVSDFFLHDGSVCYDLGCSTGEGLRILAEHNSHKSAQFIGIDCEESMTKQAQKKNKGIKNVSIINADILDVELEKAITQCFNTSIVRAVSVARDAGRIITRQCIPSAIFAISASSVDTITVSMASLSKACWME